MITSVSDFFSTLQLVILCSAATFIVGVIFSQKVKDWLAGVPSDLRSALKSVEADVLGKLKLAQADVVGKLIHASSVDSSPAVVQKPLAPTAPASAPAPAPAPQPAPAPAPADAPPVTPVAV